MNSNYITKEVVWIGTINQFNALSSLSEDIIYIIVEG